MKEKILISEDKVEIQSRLREIERFVIPQLNRVKAVFEKLDIGQLTANRLKELLFDDWRTVKANIGKEMAEQNDSAVLDQVVKKQIGVSLDGLHTELCKFLESGSSYLKCYISIDEGGKFFIPDVGLEELKDLSRVYVTSARGAELYNTHKAAAKALNDFYALAKEDMTESISSITSLFEFGENGKIMLAEQDYEMYYYAKNTPKKKDR